MDRRTFLSAGAMALGSTLSSAWAKEETNAAPHYRKALLLLPKLTEAERELLDTLPAAPVNDLGSDLIKRSEPALREMARGAELKDCDWGSDYFTKLLEPDVFMGITKLRELACLRAHYSFQDKRSNAAIADLVAAVRMGRHVGKRGPWFATIVQLATESLVIDVAAAHLPKQDGNTLMGLTTCLETLPPGGSLAASTRGEREYFLQHFRPRYENKSVNEAIELLREDFSSLDDVLRKGVASEKKAREILKQAGGDVKGLLKSIDETADLYDELARISILPSAQFSRALAAFWDKHKEPNPFGPSKERSDLEKMRYAVDRIEARFAMLRAAIKVVQGGTEQLKGIKDPFGDGPFKYRPFDGGFELKSALQIKEPPAIITVGFEKKE